MVASLLYGKLGAGPLFNGQNRATKYCKAVPKSVLKTCIIEDEINDCLPLQYFPQKLSEICLNTLKLYFPMKTRQHSVISHKFYCNVASF